MNPEMTQIAVRHKADEFTRAAEQSRRAGGLGAFRITRRRARRLGRRRPGKRLAYEPDRVAG
jgi:hypothetical protein